MNRHSKRPRVGNQNRMEQQDCTQYFDFFGLISNIEQIIMKDIKERIMSGKCKYCNSTSYGSGCSHSPHKHHEHIDDEKHCIYCGSSSYGSGCSNSPNKKHMHGSGANKCRYCGSSSTGSGCPHNPAKVHEK